MATTRWRRCCADVELDWIHTQVQLCVSLCGGRCRRVSIWPHLFNRQITRNSSQPSIVECNAPNSPIKFTAGCNSPLCRNCKPSAPAKKLHAMTIGAIQSDHRVMQSALCAPLLCDLATPQPLRHGVLIAPVTCLSFFPSAPTPPLTLTTNYSDVRLLPRR